MQQLMREGKITHWGMPEVIEDTIRRAHAVCPVTALQNRYSIMARWYENLFPVLEELGIGYVAFSPLAKGFLSGKYDKTSRFDPQTDYRSVMPQFRPESIDRNQALLSLMNKLAANRGATPAQISLAWMLCRKPYLVPIPGTRRPERLRENAGAADIALSAGEVSAIDRALDGMDMSPVFGGTPVAKAYTAFRKDVWIVEYVALNNGVRMPMAGIGTFMLTPDEAEASVLSALQDGYQLIDTANAYVNEKAVGRAMRKSGVPRDRIFLETKLWPALYEQPDAVEKTLARLDTDYIDLLLIHQPAGNYLAGYRQMERAYQAGRVRAIGLSNFGVEQIEEIMSMCTVKPAVLQIELHPYHQERKLKALLRNNGIVPQAWYPLGHGDRALLEEPMFVALGRKYGKTPAQIILRWHIQDGNVVIPGSKNPAHIRDNLNLFDFALTEDEMAQVAALNRNVRYYTSTPELLERYAQFVPPVDAQK